MTSRTHDPAAYHSQQELYKIRPFSHHDHGMVADNLQSYVNRHGGAVRHKDGGGFGGGGGGGFAHHHDESGPDCFVAASAAAREARRRASARNLVFAEGEDDGDAVDLHPHTLEQHEVGMNTSTTTVTTTVIRFNDQVYPPPSSPMLHRLHNLTHLRTRPSASRLALLADPTYARLYG